ncbi:MAG: hypothetical protein ACFFD1_08960, partial [Candidatus Thorarchaeota archaeon]
EFTIISREFSPENIISLGQSWEIFKQNIKEDQPLNNAFYDFVLENRDSLDFEVNHAFYTLLGQILYFKGYLHELTRMIVPSQSLLLLYQSLANFYLGRFQRSKELSKNMLIILDYSNINLACFVYSVKIWFDTYFSSEIPSSPQLRSLAQLVDTYKGNHDELDKNILVLSQATLLLDKSNETDKLKFVEENIHKLDSWSQLFCFLQLVRYYKNNSDNKRLREILSELRKIAVSLPFCPDIYHWLFINPKETFNELEESADKIKELPFYYIQYLLIKNQNKLLTEEEEKKLGNYYQIKNSLPLFIQNQMK